MGGLKSQQVGKSWEQEIISMYYDKGWQPFKIPTEIMGTCFDIILIKNSAGMCVEAKHIQGAKLYFKSSGLYKKQDELNHFIKHSSTNVYLFIKSDKTGCFWTSWLKAYPILNEKGSIAINDCIKMEV